MIVNLDELRAVLAYINTLNRTELSTITWVDDRGQKIEVDKELIDSWRFIGLSNKDFAELILMQHGS